MRGVGIVAMAYLPRCAVHLIVDLAPASHDIERLPEPGTVELCGLAIPRVSLAAFDASTPAKIRFALARSNAEDAEPRTPMQAVS